MKDVAKWAFRTMGLDVRRFPRGDTLLGMTMRLVETYGVDHVLDVGANVGQYALGLRSAGYVGPIISFEPVDEAFALLAERAARDDGWQAFPYALGSEDGERTLHVSAGTDVSSFLEIVPGFVANDHQARTVRTERVRVARVDSVMDPIAPDAERVMLKCDTQGFDLEVIRGASAVLDRIVVIQVELSVIPIYEGMIGYLDAIRELGTFGFAPVDFYLVSQDEQLRAVELDGLFVRA
jgi:FkbM family methyltransferase